MSQQYFNLKECLAWLNEWRLKRLDSSCKKNCETEFSKL